MTEEMYIHTDGVDHVGASTNGDLAILKFKGPLPSVVIPSDAVIPLIRMLSQCASQFHSNAHQVEPNVVQILSTESCQLQKHPDGKSIVLSFRIPGGLEFSFQILKQEASHFREAIDAVLGNLQPPDDTIPKH
jgi:hypothetical protein